MTLSNLKEMIQDIEATYRSTFQEISDYLFHHPELGGEEYMSSKYLGDFLKSHGFDVTFPYKEMETAFVASYGEESGPAIAFLAEYDALPGYETPSGNGHACGHNWIASTMCGTAVVLSKLKGFFKGKILLIGTPAEETYGAKVDMVKRGAFDKIDLVIQAHLESETVIDTCALAMSSLEFEFVGKAAHAASYPEDGINALDAVQLTFMGMNALRQHIKSDARIHGIITEGGVATNIVPEKGVCQITVRSTERPYMEYLVSRVIDCAKGAALMTGAKVNYRHFENTFYNLINVPTLMSLAKENLMEAGIGNFLNKEDAPPPGSTDIGNVSHVCPTLYMEIDLEADRPFKVHAPEALEYVNSSFAYRKMSQIIIATASTAMELYCNPQKIALIQKEHQDLMHHQNC